MGYQKKEDQIQKKRFYKVARNVRKLMKSSQQSPNKFSLLWSMFYKQYSVSQSILLYDNLQHYSH